MNTQHEIASLAEGTDVYNPMTLPDLYGALKTIRPDLTVGQFHDMVRESFDANEIRLLPWTRCMAAIAGCREALFLDGEVMYYVRVV
jgi:hypothetical protein